MASITQDYASYFLNIPGLDFLSLIGLFLLTLFRIVPIVIIPPFLGGKLLPVPLKIGVAIVLAVVFLPIVVHTTSTKIPLNAFFAGYALKELLVGFFLAFMIALPFFIIQNSGILIDFMRGSSSMMQQDPSLQNQASPIGVMYNYLLICLFFQIDGPFLFFDALVKSYQLIPPDGFLHATFFSINHPITKKILDLLNILAAISLQLGSPAMLAILMTEMFLGIANRLAPQVQIAFLGMSLKSLAGLGFVWLSFYFVLQQTAKFSLDWINEISRLLDMLR